MTIGLEARGHTSGDISALLDSDRVEEASELEEFKIKDKEIPYNRENQNDITPNPKKQKFKRNHHHLDSRTEINIPKNQNDITPNPKKQRNHHHLDSRPERNITNSGGYSAFKLNNNLWKCELEI